MVGKLTTCSKTVPKHFELQALGIALSEKQIPQIVGNVERGTEWKSRLGTVEVRPRQGRNCPLTAVNY